MFAKDILIKKRIIKNFIIVSVIGIALVSCGKHDDDKEINDISFHTIFDQFWSGMSSKYVYWYKDSLEWNRIYFEYSNKFSKLDHSNSNDRVLAIDYFQKIISPLIDGHFYLEFHEKELSGLRLYPKRAYLKRTNAHLLNYQYFSGNYYYAKNIESDIDQSAQVLIGSIDDNLYYVGINNFNIGRTLTSNINSKFKLTCKKLIDDLTSGTVNTKKLILDLRDNSGGDLADLNVIMPLLLERSLVIGSTRSKSSKDPFSYTPWIKTTINPSPVRTKSAPEHIAVLVNKNTSSLAEIFAISLSGLSNTNIIGEKTAGITGIQGDPKIFLSGSFDIPNFMTVNMTSLDYRSADNSNYEGVGLQPKTLIRIDTSDTVSNSDPYLEAAIKFLHEVKR